MKRLLTFPFRVLFYLFGRINWNAPPWLIHLNTVRKDKPSIFWSVTTSFIILLAAYVYYDSLPKSVTVIANVQASQITHNYEGAEPDSLIIEFNYDLTKLKKGQPSPAGLPSVARIDLVGEKITSGITLSPVMKGQWVWENDRRIQFKPENDWPADQEYTLTFNQDIFSTETKLTRDTYSFTTPTFEAVFVNSEFYQDPLDVTVRKVISTVVFSHPVDKKSFEQSIFMGMRPTDSTATVAPTPYQYTVSYSKNQREAYIQSQPLTLPSKPNYMKINIAANVKTLLGGEPLSQAIETKVLVPDLYSFLKVKSTRSEIIKNRNNVPEQVILIEFTDSIDETHLLDKLSVYLLPQKNPAGTKYQWNRAKNVSERILSKSQRVNLKLIPNERRYSKLYSFVIDVPEKRYLHLKVESDLTSVNNYVHSDAYATLLRSQRYPKEVSIAGEGTVLTYSGDHKLSVLSRGVSALKYSIGRLVDGQLNHLISQTAGDITNANFQGWTFNKNNIADISEEVVNIRKLHNNQPNYSSLDLTHYLPQQKNQFGLFFIDVHGWDKKKKRNIYGVKDSRLILVTDLGLIVKKNANNSHEVFVQSIQTGLPVAGATVDVLGKNGLPLYTKVTSAKGHTVLPSLNNFRNEKQPTVFVVRYKNDISFIPFDRSSRQINYSNFNIGGIKVNPNQKNALTAFAFTDRGIYRPGEKATVGFVVKNLDFTNVEGIPLEVVVQGPRNNELKVKKLTLPEKGFFDFTFPTSETSDTGYYSASLHLIRSNKYRGKQIGSVSFKVEEFQADTMKIVSRLADVGDRGWSDKNIIKAKVSLQNLFGLPAQNRKLNGRLIITPADFKFKEYKGFNFTDQSVYKNKKPLHLDKMLDSTVTDADGLATFDLNLDGFREGTYDLRFIAEGFDQAGGRSVVSANNVLISPLEHLVGYKADGSLDYIHAKSKRSINFIAINKQLKQLDKQHLVFKKLEIQQISTLIKQANGTYAYQSTTKEDELDSHDFEIDKNGKKITLDTQVPGNYAIEIYDDEQRRLARINYSVVGDANLAGKLDKNAQLQLKLDKTDYRPGGVVEMNIKAPYAGAGLITIETDKVHTFKWFKTDVESTIQSISIPEGLEGTGYVNVAFVRDVGSKEIFTSPLSYAVQPFSIDKSKRKIDITLSVNDVVRPGKPMDISFSTSQPSKIALFAVDEGILQVAKYSEPNPLGHFLKKRALDVKTMQILDLILPEFKLLKVLSASGGGSGSNALAKNLNPFSRKADKPAVYWSGIQNAGSKLKTVTFDVPNTFAGQLRVMAVAVGDEAVGATSDKTLVRGPFVISPNVLTQTAPGDEFLVTVGVANIISGSGKNAAVSVNVNVSKHLEIIGSPSTNLIIDEGSEGKFSFKVRAKDILGAAEISFTASHKNEELTRTASLSVRPAMPYVTQVESGFSKGRSMQWDSKRHLYTNFAQQSVAASASPLVLVDGLTSYLESFPHGCTEQVVSKVFPLVGLMTHPAYGPHMVDVQSHFNHVIDKLRERQHSDGGFAFWPGKVHSADYPTIYAMHFLIEAQDLGYPVPTDMIQRGKSFLKYYVGKPANSLAQARNRANALYLLTRLGEVTTNYLVDLQEYVDKNHNKVWTQDLLSAYMAATYQLLHKENEAAQLISGYTLNNKNQMQDDFHSNLSLDAQYIGLLAKHFTEKAKNLSSDDILKLTSKIYAGEYNTISAAYTILALGAYSQLVLDHTAIEAITFLSHTDKAGKERVLNAQPEPFMTASYGVNDESLTIKSGKPFYYLNVQSGFDIDLPKQATRNGLEIHRDFLDQQGNKITSFEQGKEVSVRLRVRALDGKTLNNIAVIDLLPGGFDVVRSSVSRKAYGWMADYLDIREDRVVYYGSFDDTVRELSYKVKLTAAGTFVIPPSYAESMYDRSIRAVSKSGTFNVTASK